MKYQFYINQERDEQDRLLGMMRGYVLGDKLELAYEGYVSLAPSINDACVTLFNKFNSNHPADYHNRSMSVGDVIVFTDPVTDTYPHSIAWSVAPEGFTRVKDASGNCRFLEEQDTNIRKPEGF